MCVTELIKNKLKISYNHTNILYCFVDHKVRRVTKLRNFDCFRALSSRGYCFQIDFVGTVDPLFFIIIIIPCEPRQHALLLLLSRLRHNDTNLNKTA